MSAGADEDRLLNLLVGKLPAGWQVTDVDLQRRQFRVVVDGLDHCFVLSRQAVLDLLSNAGAHAAELWPGTSPVEAAARLLSIHLEECFDTREPGPRRLWIYHSGQFVPDADQ